MKLFEAKLISQKILVEYSTNKDSLFTSFSGKKNSSHTGKKADNIAVGKTKAYKDNTYLTKYEKQYPHLAKITQTLKTEKPEIAYEIIGPALKELLMLTKSLTLKRDEKGQFILPMGDNLRLITDGKQYFVKYLRKDKND